MYTSICLPRCVDARPRLPSFSQDLEEDEEEAKDKVEVKAEVEEVVERHRARNMGPILRGAYVA